MRKAMTCSGSSVTSAALSQDRPAYAALPRYLVVLPAFNEEETIGSVIDEVREHVPFADIVVINDGSTDGTALRARDKAVPVVSLPFNLGYGAALQTGFRLATREGYDFVITIDADGQHVPACIHNLIEALERHDADVVIGSRFYEGSFKVGLAKRIGIWLFSLIGKTYTGIKITDPTSGFQLLKRSAFAYLAEGDNYPLDYPDVNIIMALHKMNYRVVEKSVTMREKNSTKSMHRGLRPAVYVARMCLAILMVLLRRGGEER